MLLPRKADGERRGSAGAPPDAFFSGGQKWGFPPLRPEAARAEAHGYFADCLRHQMRFAGMLRLDHVMSLHRLFWIPEGGEPSEGVYVRYPADSRHAPVAIGDAESGVGPSNPACVLFTTARDGIELD